MKLKLTVAAIVLASLAACSGDEVSFETQESQRMLAKKNSDLNARSFRSRNQHVAGLGINNHGDTTIGPACVTGDGWASVDLINENGRVKYQLKCSTASLSIGCLEKSVFIKKAYADQDGSCNENIPFPLPKLGK